MRRRPLRAMVLAAGAGRRLRPLTARTAKPALPLMGRPLVEYVLRRLGRMGFEEAVVAAQGDLTAQAIAETFLAAAVVTAIGLGLAFVMRNRADEPRAAAVSASPQTSATGVPMSGPQRHLVPVIGALGALVLLCLVPTGVGCRGRGRGTVVTLVI